MSTQGPTCGVCGKPLADGAYVCTADALSLAQRLREAAGHAEDAWTVIARQARYGAAGGGRKAEPEPVAVAEDLRRNPVTTFGWAASIERPPAGGLRPGEIPPDLSASAVLADVGNVVTTWARHVCEQRGTELPVRRPRHGPVCADACAHGSCAGIRRRRPPSDLGEAAAWLATQVGWLRSRPEAVEAWDELHDACARLARLVDRPAGPGRLIGVCDCGAILYAKDGRTVVQCRNKLCQMTWHVERSREILQAALREKLFTAAEAAHLAASWDERGSEQIRKLINSWVSRDRITARGWIAGNTGEDEARWPTYRFGDILDLLEQATPRRTREGAAA